MKSVNKVLLSILFLSIIGMPVYGQTIEYDKKAGENKFEEIVKTYGLYSDTNMTNYINKVGQRLVSHLDSSLFDFKFFIVDNHIPNAFALPGGYIFITTGLIPILNTEEELAGVIAHEIIHSNNRHAVRQLRKRILPVILTLPINIAGTYIPGVSIVSKPIMTLENLMFASYSRKFETEADEQGVALASKSGYDPLALKRALDRIMYVFEYLTGEKEKKSALADHPYTPIREKNIIEVSDSLKTIRIDPITKDFIAEFKGLIYGKSVNRGIIKKNAFIQAKKDLFVQFPEFWQIENQDTVLLAQSIHRDAVFTLKTVDSTATGKEIAEEYIKNLNQEHKKAIVKSGICIVNNKKAYEVQFEEVFYSDTTYGRAIWITIGENSLNINTISDIKENHSIEDILYSLRTLTKEEKESVKVQYIDIVMANNKETVTELCKRTNNKINPSHTALLNGIDLKTTLVKGQEIKIIQERIYTPQPLTNLVDYKNNKEITL